MSSNHFLTIINIVMNWGLFQSIHISFFPPAQRNIFSLASLGFILFPIVSVAFCSVSHHLMCSSVSSGPDPKARPFNLPHLFHKN